MEPADLLPLVADLLPSGPTVVTPDPRAAAAAADVLGAAAVRQVDAGGGPAAWSADDPADVVLLLADELAAAGERAPALLDAAVGAARSGGWLVVAVRSKVHADLTGDGGDARAWIDASTLAHLLAERGLDTRRTLAPGAAAGLAGRPWGGVADVELDATPGLLDAAPVLLAAARTPKTDADRSRVFFSSIHRRIVAAAALIRDAEGRVLMVFDTFKGTWTIPGGLVDDGESPIEAAVREAREEGGVDVRAGRLLGVFAHEQPARVQLVYEAAPLHPVADPVPLHTHEIAEVAWMPLDEARARTDAHMRRKLDECLTQPGRTWRW